MPRIHRHSPLTSFQHVTRDAPAKELNTRRCPICGAKRGQTCFVLTDSRFIELKVTHATKAREEGKPLLPKGKRRSPRIPMALDRTLDAPPPGRKTSTEKLDREYAWRKAREAAEARRRNGG